MISIDRLEEMAIEELETKLNNWKEQVELQSNFIDSLLKATNNSEWLDKTILDDEATEIIEKIELDYAQLNQLKAEVKSKTEYIQEQRDIINQYSKEIEMYKKCQGKRASKREEELKAENDNIKETFDGLFKVQYKLADNNKKLRQCLTEIKEIAEKQCVCGVDCIDMKQILQKISEVENG